MSEDSAASRSDRSSEVRTSGEGGPDVPDIYTSGEYLLSNAAWHEPDGPWKAEQVRSFLDELRLSPQSISDVGCGTGLILETLGRMFHAPLLVGFEVSEYCIEAIRAKASPVQVVVGSAGTYTENRFDLCLILDVIEHVEDYLGFMRSLRHLADVFIYHVPLDMAVQTVARSSPLMQSRASIGHLHYFSHETAIASVEHAGYEVIGWRYTTGSPDYRTSPQRKAIVDSTRAVSTRVLGPRLSARLLGGFSLLIAARRAEE